MSGCEFYVGQKVVCVDDDAHREWPANQHADPEYVFEIRRGETYTIDAFDTGRDGSLALHLQGLREGQSPRVPFLSRRFRPLEEKPDAIEVFRQIARDVSNGKVRKLEDA